MMKKVSHLTLSIFASLTASLGMLHSASASGLEYTKQSILPFFEKGNYAELVYADVDISIEAEDASGNKIEDMMDNFNLPGAAVKLEPTENTAVAFIYDTPFGVDTIYQAGSDYTNEYGTTEARLHTKGLTTLVGRKFEDSIWVYGGLEYQLADGSVTAATPDPDSGRNTFYKLTIKDGSETLIPVVGVAYEIPEIMLRAALTYRAKGNHEVDATENLIIGKQGILPALGDYNKIDPITRAIGGLPDLTFGDINLKINTPQSVNLDFQTGLSEKYQLLGMVNARWVDWSAFEIAPKAVTELTKEPLAYYNKDQLSVEVALAKQITPKFAGEVRVGYDTGTGEPLSLLGPYNSTKSIAMGGQYDINENLLVAGGAQYMWLEGGNVTSKDGSVALAKADDGKIVAVGMKVGYRF